MAVIVQKRFPVPSRNGVQLQFSSIDLALGDRGVFFPWINEISYEQNLEPGEARGTSPYPMGASVGELKATGSLTIQRIYRETLINIVENGTPGFMTKFFPISVAYQEFGWGQVETDSFDARITGTGHEYSAGNNVLMVKLPLYIPFVRLAGHIPIEGIPL